MSVLRRQTLMRLFTDIFAYQKKHPTNMWTRIYTCSHIGTYEFTFITYWRSKKTAWKMNPSICDLMQVLTMYTYWFTIPSLFPCYLSHPKYGHPAKTWFRLNLRVVVPTYYYYYSTLQVMQFFLTLLATSGALIAIPTYWPTTDPAAAPPTFSDHTGPQY